MPELDDIFRKAVQAGASDIHLSPGEPAVIRRCGRLVRLEAASLSLDRCKEIISEVLDADQRSRLTRDLQLDFAYELAGLGRLRGSAMIHRTGLSAAFRIIPPSIPAIHNLGLPEAVKQLLDNHMGLILITGATGHGKSTTLASMVDYLNDTRSHHILTIEDPIEFVHPLKRGVVSQRQLGTNTLSYANALRAALREDPDVIMVGELRDLETISLAITAAETGHLVLGTLSTSSAPKTVDRIIDSFPPGEQNQIRAMLSESLRAVITQRLIPRTDGTGMVLALEILIGTLPVANLIRDGKVFQITSLMQTKKNIGMQIMDDALFELHKDGIIGAEDAWLNASNKERFKPLADRAKQAGAKP